MQLSIRNRSARTCLAALLTGSLAACGGGGGSASDPTSPDPAPGSDSTTVSSQGVITGFGSVYVNDTRYALDDDTRVVANDDERVGDDGALALGMKVKIRATERDGERVAESIRHRRDLKGPVTRLMIDDDDPSLGTFFVANTRVVVDANTVFSSRIGDQDGNGDIDVRDLTVENGRLVVAVSGFASDDGYLASRVDRVSGNDDDDEIEIKGFVTAVDSDAGTFVVNGTEFLVSGATEFADGLVFGPELEGVFVEVEGVRIAAGYEAREVEREDDDDDDARRDRFEIEGILVSVDTEANPNVIRIGGQTIEVANAQPLTGLVGSRVQIKGFFNGAGLLVVDLSRLRDDQRIATEDRVMSVDAAGGTFTTRLGLDIRPEGVSRLEDDDNDDDRLTPEQFLNRLRTNDYIEARGSLNDDGSVTWTRIEREDEDDDEQACELRGPVESIADDRQSFVILGVTIDVAAGRDVQFEDDDDDLDRDDFFDRLETGTIVKAESDDDDVNACQNGLMLAEEVELGGGGPPPFVPPVGGGDGGNDDGASGDGVVFLIIDADSIDNGNPPNDFTAEDVNDQLAAVGLRQPLAWFQDNVGSEIDLFTGQVGDEGWFALKTIPAIWQDAGPTGNGTRNYLQAGPGLGGPPDGDDREVLLDEIPDVTPLRATGLAMLTGRTVCAVVYDSDISVNYDPLQGNLQGNNLGVVSFEVLAAAARTDGSSSDLPRVSIRAGDAAACEQPLVLFDNAPVPVSSSEPEDTDPPATPPAPRLVPAV
ncbi:MAG: DUF5666 domain-containing protein [Gammaproteobacteria bacterium]|nr:DUF5666 domain-containing protein [Gammaproteobacteria bacterium]